MYIFSVNEKKIITFVLYVSPELVLVFNNKKKKINLKWKLLIVYC